MYINIDTFMQVIDYDHYNNNVYNNYFYYYNVESEGEGEGIYIYIYI